MLEYTVKMTEDDYLKFNMNHTAISKSGKSSLLLIRIIVPVVLFPLLVLGFEDLGTLLIGIFVWAIASCIWLFFSRSLIKFCMKMSIKGLKRDGKLPYSENSRLVFDEEEIHEYSDETETIVKYANLEKICLTTEAIYIYFNAHMAFPIPANTFESKTNRDELVHFLKEKVDKEKFVAM